MVKKQTKQQIKRKLFQQIRFINCLGIQSSFSCVIYFVIKLLSQLCILPFQKILFDQNLARSISSIKSYILFYMNENYKNSDINLIISLSILIGLLFIILLYVGLALFVDVKKIYVKSIIMRFISLFFLLLYPILIGFIINFTINCININKFYYLLITIPLMILLMSVVLILQKFLFTYSYKKQIGLVRNYSYCNQLKFCILTILIIQNTIRKQPQISQAIISILIFFLYNCFSLIIYFRIVSYYNLTTSIIHLSQIQFKIIIMILCLLQMQADLFRQNLIVVILTTFIFSVFAMYNYLTYSTIDIIIQDPNKIQNEDVAMQYIRSMHNLTFRYNQQMESMILAGLITKHIKDCKDVQCICKAQTSQIALYKDKKFLVRFALKQMLITQQKYKNSLKIFLMIQNFKLEICQLYTKILMEIKQWSSVKKSLPQQYLIEQITESLQLYLQQKNQQQKVIKIDQVHYLENIKQQLKQLMKQFIKISIQRWRKINRGLCQLNQIQQLFIKSVEIIKKIQCYYKQIQKLNPTCIQIYLLFLSYYQNIVFFNTQIKKISKNIQKIQIKLKFIKKVNLNNLRDIIFNNKTVVVVSPIHNMKIGQISNITKNSFEVFGLQSNKMINQNISMFIPAFLLKQHNKILQNWIQFGGWNVVNHLRQTFCMNIYQQYFQVILYLRITPSFGQLKFMAAISKRNQQDYLILNDRFYVQGYGHKFIQLLGKNFKKKNFKSACNSIDKLIITAKLDQPQKKSIIVKTLANPFQSNIQQIQQQENINDPQKLINIYLDRFFQYKGENNKKHLSIRNSIMRDTSQIIKNIYQIRIAQVQYFQTKMGSIKYYVIKLLSLSKPLSQNTIMNPQPDDNFQSKQFSRKKQILTRRTGRLLSQIPESSLNVHSQTQLNSVQIFGEQPNNYGLDSINNSSSIQGSQYFYHKTLSQVLRKLYNPKQIHNPRLLITTIFIFITLLLLIGCISGSLLFYKQGLISYNKVIFGDGAVSDNMQLLQFQYNKLMMMYQYYNDTNQDRFNYIVKSTKSLSIYLYSLITDDFQYYIKNMTFTTNQYIYMKHPIQFKLFTQTIQIQTNQFMQHFHHSTIKIMDMLEKRIKNQQTDLLINLLRDNWRNLQQINHYNLQVYASIGFQQLFRLKIILYLMLLVFIIFTIFFGICINQYLLNKQTKKKNILMINKLIPSSFIQCLKNYYINLETQFKQNQQSMIQLLIPQKQFQNKTQFIYQKSWNYKYLIIITVMLLILCNSITFYQMFKLFPSCEMMMNSINGLMDSQNNMIQAYFQLKDYYLFNKIKMNQQQFQNNIMKHLQQIQVQFNQKSIQSLRIFIQYDDSFFNEFIDLLIKDVCLLTKSQFKDWQVQKCIKMRLPMLKHGVISGMNFYQRKVYKAAKQLKNSNERINQNDYFKQIQFEEIDDYLYYMFKMYQATQARMIEGLAKASTHQINMALTTSIIVVLVLITTLIGWSINYPFEKQELSLLYGYIALFPSKAVKENKLIIKTINENLYLEE